MVAYKNNYLLTYSLLTNNIITDNIIDRYTVCGFPVPPIIHWLISCTDISTKYVRTFVRRSKTLIMLHNYVQDLRFERTPIHAHRLAIRFRRETAIPIIKLGRLKAAVKTVCLAPLHRPIPGVNLIRSWPNTFSHVSRTRRRCSLLPMKTSTMLQWGSVYAAVWKICSSLLYGSIY